MSGVEYEEFEVAEVKREYIGMEFIQGSIRGPILDVGETYFFIDTTDDGITMVERRQTGRRFIRRPIQKPKMKRVALSRFRDRSHENWTVCTRLFESWEEARNVLSSKEVVWPHGEFFEVPE